ncbi:MAG TPA: hypothetical protein VEL75_20265 [Candidatus Methylomirabilis sp.]|nr:hypothetical protein [Candidatus Methylomirabilis sp.]
MALSVFIVLASLTSAPLSGSTDLDDDFLALGARPGQHRVAPLAPLARWLGAESFRDEQTDPRRPPRLVRRQPREPRPRLYLPSPPSGEIEDH